MSRKDPWWTGVTLSRSGPGSTEAKRICRRRRAALLKIEPDLPDAPELAARLTGFGFRPSPQRIQPLSTIVIDLAPDIDAILACMKPKWRYNIRLAERKGVTVRSGTQADLPAIQSLLDLTGKRDGFGVHSPEYYALATQIFAPPGVLNWLVAEHEGQMLAAIAVFAFGSGAWYMWGASGEHDRNLMPNHALQWAAICWAKERGCQVYDLWGIPDEVGRIQAPTRSPRVGERVACGASIVSSKGSAAVLYASPAPGICRFHPPVISFIAWLCACAVRASG